MALDSKRNAVKSYLPGPVKFNNLFFTDSTIFSCYFDKSSFLNTSPFDQIHQQSQISETNLCPPIQQAKITFYDSLLRKDITNNPEYLFSAYFEPVEIANKITNFDEISSLLFDPRSLKTNKDGKKVSKHISINHFSNVEKRYGQNSHLKLPQIKLSTLESAKTWREEKPVENLVLPPILQNREQIQIEQQSKVDIEDVQSEYVNMDELNDKEVLEKCVNMLGVGSKFLGRLILQGKLAEKRENRKLKQEMRLAAANQHTKAKDPSGTMNNSKNYLASIGQVPSLYPTRKIKHFKKKFSRSPTFNTKVNQILNNGENNQTGPSYYASSKYNTFNVHGKMLNLDNKNMMLKQRYKIGRHVDDSLKFTTMLGERKYDSSMNSIRLNFTSVPSEHQSKPAKKNVVVNNKKKAIDEVKSSNTNSFVLPDIFRKK